MSERYILGDWGTTHLRLYLIDGERVTSVRAGAGIGNLGVEAASDVLLSAVQPWLGAARPMEVVLGGMASARNGMKELPYVPAPARAGDWMQGARRLSIGPLNVLLATGLQCGDEASGFDVMRGEEAQIFGAARIDPALCTGPQCFVLPGTHTKWVETEEGAIRHFRTAVTGELYGLLCEHSSLLRAGSLEENPEQFDRGFTAGMEHGMRTNMGLLTALFQTRTAQLLSGRSRTWASGFLSGLLISYECTTMQASLPQTRAITLIGESDLASLYQRVLTGRGVSARVLDGAACVVQGLRLLREQYP